MTVRIITRAAAAAFVLSLLVGTQACGGGLSHTVDDSEVKGLGGEHAERIAAKRAEVKGAEQAFAQVKKERAESEKAVAKAETTSEKAAGAVDKAEDKLDKLEDSHEKALEAAEDKRDKAIAAANKTYEKEVDEANDRFGVDSKEGKAALAEAKKVKGIEEARQAYEEALLEEREARVAALDAELWLKRAEFELTKWEELNASKQRDDVDVRERTLEFKGQVNERERAALEAKKELERAEAKTKRTKATLDKLSPPPAPAPAAPEAPKAS